MARNVSFLLFLLIISFSITGCGSSEKQMQFKAYTSSKETSKITFANNTLNSGKIVFTNLEAIVPESHLQAFNKGSWLTETNPIENTQPYGRIYFYTGPATGEPVGYQFVLEIRNESTQLSLRGKGIAEVRNVQPWKTGSDIVLSWNKDSLTAEAGGQKTTIPVSGIQPSFEGTFVNGTVKLIE